MHELGCDDATYAATSSRHSVTQTICDTPTDTALEINSAIRPYKSASVRCAATGTNECHEEPHHARQQAATDHGYRPAHVVLRCVSGRSIQRQRLDRRRRRRQWRRSWTGVSEVCTDC